MRLRPLVQILRNRRGVAAIEFAIIAPVLAGVVVATVELGFMMRAKILAQEAASAGALYASQHAFNAVAITAAVTAASNEATITASPAPAEAWGCPTVTGILAQGAGTLCADGIAARHYAVVGASVPRTSILGSAFGLPASATASSTVRLP